MQTTIEDYFFAYFEEKGLVSKCINLLDYKYDLGETPHNIPIEEIKCNDDAIEKIESDLKKFDQVTPKYRNSFLMDEINQNINSCSGQELDDYIFSLLKPFKELSELKYPIGKLNRMRLKHIKASQDGSDEGLIEKLCDSIERVEHRSEIYNSFSGVMREETEMYLCTLFNVQSDFFSLLDAILLPLHLDILNYQKEIGICLSPYRYEYMLEPKLGGSEIVDKYINELDHRKPHQRSTPEFIISPRLDTKEMKNIFKKGIELGLMEVSEQGHYKWLSTNALFSYFVDVANQKIFNKPNQARRDVKPFAELFEWESRKITQGMQDYRKTGNLPEKSKQIDSLF